MQGQRIAMGVLSAVVSFAAYSDVVKFGAVVLDDMTSMPMSDVEVCFSYKEDIGWRAWTESTPHHKMYCRTDLKGRCQMSGISNCGQAGCYVENPPRENGSPHGWDKTASRSRRRLHR